MITIGYVSDEMYSAIPDVLAEFESSTGPVCVLRSSPGGAFYSDLADDDYRVTLAKPGFGSKIVSVPLGGNPRQFRLLSDGLLGFMWPKWVRSGERSELRVHSVEQCQLSLWRYGLRIELIAVIGWYDEHGPRAMMQLMPDGDYTQTGVQWYQLGWGTPSPTQFVNAPDRTGLYYLWANTPSGPPFSFPCVVAPPHP